MSSLIRTDLRYVEDHIDAMLDANTPTEAVAVAVLRSAEKRYLGGQRLYCTAHGVELTFAELVNHTAKLDHVTGDVVPADPDPRERGRAGESGRDL